MSPVLQLVDRLEPSAKRSVRKKARKGPLPVRFRSCEGGGAPRIRDAPTWDQEDVFVGKLQQCCVLFNFSSGMESRRKMRKRVILEELIHQVSTWRGTLSEHLYPQVVNMVAVNIFRPLPPTENPNFNPWEDEPYLEPSWFHLRLVYEFFLNVLESPFFDPASCRQLVNEKFVLQLLGLFDSEDPREREALKMILHRIYEMFHCLRPFIRQEMQNILLAFVYETERFNGVSELLDVLGSVISGFAVPLREEHKLFLLKVLIPLHKAKSLELYHSQLTYCVLRFLEKDRSLSESVIRGLLRIWPKACSQKEVMFLGEMEEILDATEMTHFIRIQGPLFSRLAKCASSLHFQVAERALYFWNNEYITSLFEESNRAILPIVFPVLYRVSVEHWNTTIVSLVCSVLKICMDMNAELFNRLAETYSANREKEMERELERAKMWERLAACEDRCGSANPEGQLAVDTASNGSVAN